MQCPVEEISFRSGGKIGLLSEAAHITLRCPFAALSALFPVFRAKSGDMLGEELCSEDEWRLYDFSGYSQGLRGRLTDRKGELGDQEARPARSLLVYK